MYSALRSVTALTLIVLCTVTSIFVACTSGQNAQSSPSQPGAQTTAAAQPTSLDDLVAPIALYPDQLLGQVLSISTNPQEVLDLGNWLLQNQGLQGDAATKAAKDAGFSPSAQYLSMFPQVVDNMCQEMNWTTQLGETFKADQKSVMAAIQRKRTQAQQVGNLQSSPQMSVSTKSDNGQQYVEIKPADPKVVYVPQYNPVTIYNTPAPAAPAPATTTTTEEKKSGVSTGAAVAIGLLSFGVGMAVGSAIHHDDYYPYPAWGYGGVYYGRYPYYPPPYRPPVYPGYRPVYGYNPPPNYRWSQYNNNVNVNINNNYYGRFNNTTVNRPSTLPANNTYLGANNNRPGVNPNIANTRAGNQGNGRGQSTYQGARPNAGTQRPGASMANAIPPAQQVGGNRGGNQMAANAGTRDLNRPNAGASAASNRAAKPTQPANRPSAGNQPMNRPSSANQPMNRGGDRGYGAANRPSGSAPAPSARPAPSAPAAANRGGALGSGNSARRSRRQRSRPRQHGRLAWRRGCRTAPLSQAHAAPC